MPTRVSNLGVYGLGKLGLPLAASFAAAGVRTYGIDIDARHIDILRRGEVPFQEPGLGDLLRQAAGQISFHREPVGLDLSISLVQVPTPSDQDNPSFSARMVAAAVQTVCEEIQQRPVRPEQHLVIIASTVMPGTLHAMIRPMLDGAQKQSGCRYDLAYVPDLVAIGDVVKGFRKPSVLIIGADDDATGEAVSQLYGRIVVPETPRALLTISEAEITKVAWNFFLCFRISYANMLARLAQHAQSANVDKITETVSLDPRFGKGFLKAGMPFGGPCFPRDVEAMRALLVASGDDDAIARAVKESNDGHYDHIVEAILSRAPLSVGVLGLAFKAGTDVTIESPSFELVRRLLGTGRTLWAWDPSERAREALAADTSVSGARLASTSDDLFERSDVIVLAVNDRALATLCGSAAPRLGIVDPWGVMPADAASIIRPGRGGLR